MSYHYQQTAASASQLGLHPRTETPGMPSPSPSMRQSLEKEHFLAYQQSSPPMGQLQYSPQPAQSFFDTQGHISGAAEKGGRKGFFRRNPCLGVFITLVIVAGIAGGIVAGLMLPKKSDVNANKDTSSSPHNSGSPTAGPSAAPTPTVTPLARYNWLDPNNVAYGVNIGNWLVLERWLDEDWFSSLCADCEDEWNLSAHLGANAIPTLQQHYDSFLNETDIDTMQQYGVNMIRVTLGYWALMDTPGEPFVNAGQLDRLRKLMEWCHARGIYITISMHGLPGSQSGDQSTGIRKNWDVGGSAWFTSANQARSDQAIQALATWITQQQPYSSVIASVLPVNEPKQTNADGTLHGNRQELIQDFYLRSYKTLSNIGMVMMIHPGYYQGQDPTQWDPWIKSNNLDPNLIVWETHPYPGYFPLQFDQDNIMATVCNLGQIHNSISVPVYFGEFSALSGINTMSWLRTYWNSQIGAYSNSAGSAFWTWRAKPATNPYRALVASQMTRYDFQYMMQQGIATKIQPGQTTKQFIASLPNQQCGGGARRRAHGHGSARLGGKA